jgi:hypothetical protein
MAATIKIKNSSTTGAVPTSSDLVQGELAVNVTDLGLYTENASGTIVKLNAPSIDDKGTGATKRLTIDTSGNLGLGVTPSTSWASDPSATRAIQLNGGSIWSYSTTQFNLLQNAVWNGSNNLYVNTAAASAYRQISGVHSWYNAASGTAGNAITFTQAMTLDASGNLGIGTTSPTDSYGFTRALDINGTGGAFIYLRTNGSTTNTSGIGNSGTDLYIKNNAAGNIRFFNNTEATERARIDSSGNFLVGTTSTDSGAKMRVSYGASSNGIAIQDTANTSGTPFLIFQNSTPSNIGSVSRVGTTNAVIYNTTSDYRLKTVIGPVSGYKERINALEPIEYEWKEDGTRTRGFLAHKFQESYPHSVTGEKDAVDENGNPVYQAMQAGTSEVIADLVALLQEQQAIITALTARIEALEQA